ncbi:MAG: hypothetical protein K2X37_03210 [Chitinophagaceae bacterium]|nr:hypothetical protein [Chitinophagaceae bacterium]
MYKEQKYQRLTERATIKPVKVFQIGFSKCGTVTIASFFSQNGIRTVHHDFGNLAVSMYKNYHNGKPLLSPKYQHFAVFTDMENMFMNPPLNIGMLMFKELDKQYPGSKFILNIRDKNAWLKSRSKHPLSPRNKTTILELNAELQNKSKEQILAQWSKEWDEHTQAVIKYFKNRPNDLIVFNIEKDSPEKLTEFFKDYFVLDPKLYAHKNQSSQRDMIRANAEKNRLEWNEIFGGAEDN